MAKDDMQTTKWSTLKGKKEDFEKELKKRIEKGRKLLKIPVEVVGRKPGLRQGTYEVYNEEEERKFLLEYEKWKQFNIELLKRSFNIDNNEYLQEYIKGESPTIMSEKVKERKNDIERQIAILESLIERLPLIPETN